MTLRHLACVAAVLSLMVIEIGCGDTYRPVAIPVTPPPPDPSSFHYVLMISTNGQDNRGATTRIDVSGDTNVGVAQVGLNPVHAVVLPNGSRIYVANNLEDTVSSYNPFSPQTVTTISLPQGSSPAFLATTENGTLYAANPADGAVAGTVSAISTGGNVVTNTIPVGRNPVALAETPDGRKLYAVNQGDGTVTSINVVNKSVNATIPTGASPVWVVARSDSRRVYVLNQGSGTISTIDTFSDAPAGVDVNVGVGAGFLLYDTKLNRLYVTNSGSTSVVVLDASVDPPAALPTIDLTTGGGSLCATGCTPVATTALADGTRAYVVSYAFGTDPLSGLPAILSQVSVVDTGSSLVRSVIALAPAVIDSANPTGCDAARFRLFAVASSDSSKVYISNCDGGSASVIRTSSDTLIVGNQFQVQPTDPPTCEMVSLPITIPAPSSAFPPSLTRCALEPPPQDPAFWTVPPLQNPVFLLAGP